MLEAAIIIIATSLTAYLTYRAIDLPKDKATKNIFLLLTVINLTVTLFLVLRRHFSDLEKEQKSAQDRSTLTNSIAYMLKNQDSVKQQLKGIGLNANFQNAQVSITPNDKFVKLINQYTYLTKNLSARTRSSQPKPIPITIPEEITKARDEYSSNHMTETELKPSKSQTITTEDMNESSCIDKSSNWRYSRVKFDNQTGQLLVLSSYYGYWGSPVTNEVQTLPADETTRTGRLLISISPQTEEKDFSFFFIKQDGTPCPFPFRISLRSCVEYKIVLTKAKLGL